MKIVLQKISLLVLGVLASMAINAQTIEVSATVNTPLGPQTQVIQNGVPFDATFGGFVTNFNTYLPVTITIKNTASIGSPVLTLTQVSGNYVNLSGTGATDFTVNETTLTGSIVAGGGSQTFTVGLSSTATNGSKSVSLDIKNNSTSNSTATIYSGIINYSFSGVVTSVTKASEIGLSLYPNPSTDGQMHVSAENVEVERIVVSNVSGQTEEFTSKEFKTSLKGLLLVRLYTDKGIVSEKIIIQE